MRRVVRCGHDCRDFSARRDRVSLSPSIFLLRHPVRMQTAIFFRVDVCVARATGKGLCDVSTTAVEKSVFLCRAADPSR